MTANRNFKVFSFLELRKEYEKTFLNSLFLERRIKDIKTETDFLKIQVLEVETNPQETFKIIEENADILINEIKPLLEYNREVLKSLSFYITKKQNATYDRATNYLNRFLIYLNEKIENKIFIRTEKDLSVYNAIDKRQTITKSDINLFLKKLFIRGVIKKNEYRQAIKYKSYSENIKEHIYFYFRSIHKTGHKKYLLSNARKNRREYIYFPQFRRLIKLKAVSVVLKDYLIIGEIKHKIAQEKRIYAVRQTQ